MRFKSYEIRLRVTVDEDVTDDPKHWPWDFLLGDAAVLTEKDIFTVPTDSTAIPVLRDRRHREKQNGNKA